MRIKNQNNLLRALLGAGLYLLDPVRDRLADRLDDWSSRAQDTYEEVGDRVDRASRAIRGEDHRGLGAFAALLVGLGVGVGVGMLIAPASGEQTRSNLADKMQDISGKVQDLGGKVRERFSSEQQSGGSYGQTGTYGQ
jgi:hypothetical protein